MKQEKTLIQLDKRVKITAEGEVKTYYDVKVGGFTKEVFFGHGEARKYFDLLVKHNG